MSKTNLISIIDKQEFYHRFQRFVLLRDTSQNLWCKNIKRKDHKEYIGTIDSVTNQFCIEPIVRFSRAPFIKIIGNLTFEPKKTQITLKFKLPFLVHLVVWIISFVGILILVTDYFFKSIEKKSSIIKEYPFIIATPLFLYILIYIFFSVGKMNFLKKFKRYFKINKSL